jgi:hypothetical protein
MEGSDLTRTKKGQRCRTVGWRVPASDDSILQVRNRDYHPGYRHRRDRIEMKRILRLADGSVRRHRNLAAAHLTDRCDRRTIRAATLCGGTSHHRRNAKAERKKRSNQKYGDKAHGRQLSPDRQNPQQRPKHPASRHRVRRISLDPITVDSWIRPHQVDLTKGKGGGPKRGSTLSYGKRTRHIARLRFRTDKVLFRQLRTEGRALCEDCFKWAWMSSEGYPNLKNCFSIQ